MRSLEESLRDSEARFRALFLAIDQGYCLCEIILDPAGRPVDYRFLEVNPRFAAMTGLADAVGRTAMELLPDLEFEWVETYARVAFEGAPRRFESGSEVMGRWFDVFAMPVEPRGRFALVFTDITARREAERRLRASQLAERRARRRVELVARAITDLEALDGVGARGRRLLRLLVPRLADQAVLLLPDGDAMRTLVSGTEAHPHSRAAVELDLGGGLRAALHLGLTDPRRRPYDADDRRFLAELSARVGVVLARARIQEEEHRIALSLQRALLPAALVRAPGLAMAARYEAGSDDLEVGGDWYDSFVLPDGRVGVTVGDVVGHGLDAATAMGRLRTAMAALAVHAGDPGELLAHLDRFAASGGTADVATACCAVLDPGTGAMRYASAGHPPMLVVSREGEVARLGGGRSTLLWGHPVPERPYASHDLAPGALLVLYSDGLVERRGETIDDGVARLERTLARYHRLPVAALCDRVVRELGRETARPDDVVIVLVRREG